MNRKLLVVYDKEELYVQNLVDYLGKREGFPYRIKGYTKEEELIQTAVSETIDVLLVSESVYDNRVRELPIGKIFLLNESGSMIDETIENLDKYQAGDHIVREIISYYVEKENVVSPRFRVMTSTKVIGLFSPVRRCLQTSIGITMGHILSEKHKTLYLNFESFSGFASLEITQATQNISDLLYYMETTPEKFSYRLDSMLVKLGELDCIPPMTSLHSILLVQAKQWISFLEKIISEGIYEYIILDLSESMQGLFDILRLCDKVYTIVKEDYFAKAKVEQYELLLQMYEYEDVLEKTEKREIPFIKELPSSIAYYHTGELATFVNRLVKEDVLYG